MTDDTPKNERAGATVVSFEEKRKEFERRRRSTKDRVDKLVEDMNKQYCVVPEGDDVFVYREQHDPLRRGRWRLYKFTFPAFRRLLLNRRTELEVPDPKHPGDTKTISKYEADIWLEHKDRRQCLGGAIFDPTAKVAPLDPFGRNRSYHYNLYRGLAVKPVKNHQGWALMRDHVYRMLAAGDARVGDYILDWAALMLQHPERQAEVAIIFIGETEGIGKGLFAKALIAILGGHGLHLHHQETVRGRFNAFLHQLIFLYIDEAFWAGDRQFEGYLKGIVSDEELGIEPKNRELFQAPNFLHIMMSSNRRDQVIQASPTSRRWAPFQVADQPRDRDYYARLAYEIEHGGAAAMAYDLLHRNISCFEVRDYPRTEALDTQRLLSLDILQRWWMTVLERGFVYLPRWGAPSLLAWDEFYNTQLLVLSHYQYCSRRSAGVAWNHPATEVEIGKFMKTTVGYRPGYRRTPQPIGELETIDRFEAAARRDDRQAEFPIDPEPDPEPDNKTIRASSPSDWRETAVIYSKIQMHGYNMGSLEEARARFKAALGDLPMPWDLAD